MSSCPTTLQVSIGHSELIVFESDRAVHSFPCRLRSYHPRALPLRVLLLCCLYIVAKTALLAAAGGRGDERAGPVAETLCSRPRADAGVPEETDSQMGITIDGRHYTVGKAAGSTVKVIVEGLRPHTFKRWRCEYNKNAQMQIRVQKAVDELKVGCN